MDGLWTGWYSNLNYSYHIISSQIYWCDELGHMAEVRNLSTHYNNNTSECTWPHSTLAKNWIGKMYLQCRKSNLHLWLTAKRKGRCCILVLFTRYVNILQRRLDIVDLCLLKHLRSSLIDFHISTNKLSRLLLREVPLFKSRSKAWYSHSKG